jgi:hypothetical protein
LRGGFRIISTSAGLKPRAVAGGPSVTKFTHKSCTGIIHSGIPNAAVKKMDITSPTLDDIMYLQIEEYIQLPYNRAWKEKINKEMYLIKAFMLL